jgi:hypothetical protein
MRKLTTIFAAAAAPLALGGVLLGTAGQASAAAASAAAVTPAVTTAAVTTAGPTGLSATVHSTLVNRPDGGGAGDTWALDNTYRAMTLTMVGQDGGEYEYVATIHDIGTFTTVKGALAPNQGGNYAGTVEQASKTGVMSGYADFSFEASSLPSLGAANLGVPTTVQPGQGDTSAWYQQAFPSGTTFSGPGIGNWGWEYHMGSQHWADTYANNDGQATAATASADGNITA